MMMEYGNDKELKEIIVTRAKAGESESWGRDVNQAQVLEVCEYTHTADQV